MCMNVLTIPVNGFNEIKQPNKIKLLANSFQESHSNTQRKNKMKYNETRIGINIDLNVFQAFLFINKQKNIQQKTVRLLKQNEICKELGKICGDLFIVMWNILLFRSFFVPPFCSLMCTKESNGKNKEEK